MNDSLCNDWFFTEHCDDAFLRGEPAEAERVRLPHTCRELPLHYAAPKDYEMVCGYRRYFAAPESGDRLFLRFDGAAHQAEVFVNGKKALSIYERMLESKYGKTTYLPSTSPANAAWSVERLIEVWSVINC